jgi:filamentous hemagglutinin family protein
MKLIGKIKRRLARQKSKTVVSLAAFLAAAALTGQSFAAGITANAGTGSTGITISPASGLIQNIAILQNGVINWNQFNIANGETVNFNFSGTANGVLNRVTGGSASQIAGIINALSTSTGNPYGTVLLVNPAGIVFGNGATINVPTFIASTYNISDEMFLNQLKNGGTFTLTSNGSTGKIYFNGNTALTGSTNLVAIGNAITVAPGVTITAAGTDSGISLNAFDSYTFNAKFGNNGKLYTQLAGYTSKEGNNITIGDATGGAALTANWISLLGNTVSINGSANSKSTITSLGMTSDASIDIIAGSGTVDLANQTITSTASSANKIAINNAFIGVTDFQDNATQTSTSAQITIAGGSVDINGSTLKYGNSHYYDANNPKANGAYIIASNSATLSRIPQSNKYKSIIWQADNTNTINITNSNVLTDNSETQMNDLSRLALLGGKVEATNTTIKVGEFFIGAAKYMALEAQTKDDNSGYWDEYYFNHEYAETAFGNTVTLNNSNILANGEAAIFANSFTNTGNLTAAQKWGIAILAFDKYSGNYTTMQSYLDVSKNNTITNTGTITTPNGEFVANSMTNTGTIKISDGGNYLLALADNITGNSITGNATGTVALGVNDPKYNPNAPFNRIILTSIGNNDDDVIAPSFARIGSSVIDTSLPLAAQAASIAQAARKISDPQEAAVLLKSIISIGSVNQEALLRAALNSYVPTQSALERAKGQINTGTKAPSTPAAQGSAAGAPAVAASSAPNAGVTVAPPADNAKPSAQAGNDKHDKK